MDRVVSSAVAVAEVDEIIIVVGYHARDVIQHFQRHPVDKRVTYVSQRAQRGLVDAIECARPRVDPHETLLLLGDEVMVDPRYQDFIDDFRARELFASIGSVATSDPDRIRKTYTFSYDEASRVRKLIEKPNEVLSPRMGTGAVLFSPGSLSYIALTRPHPERHERDLAGVLQTMADHGRAISWFDICDRFANVNTIDDLSDARGLIRPTTQHSR